MSSARTAVFGGPAPTVGVLAVSLLDGSTVIGSVAVASGAIPLPAGFPVDRFLAHWWVFPASVLFALVALASGVSGALFFSPSSCWPSGSRRHRRSAPAS